MTWEKGKSGNAKGRPVAPEKQLFREALALVEKKKGKKFFVHACERAFDDDGVLKEVLKKMLPDLSEIKDTTDYRELLKEALHERFGNVPAKKQ